MITLTSPGSVNGAATGIVPVIMHDACIDDARWTGNLRALAQIHEAGAGSNAEAASNARVGAIVHAVAEARVLLAAVPTVAAADADPSTPATTAATVEDRMDELTDDVPDLVYDAAELAPVRSPDEEAGGA